MTKEGNRYGNKTTTLLHKVCAGCYHLKKGGNVKVNEILYYLSIYLPLLPLLPCKDKEVHKYKKKYKNPTWKIFTRERVFWVTR